MADIEIEVEDSNPETMKNTDNMNDVDIDGMEVEDETMKDVVGNMDVEDYTTELKKDVMDIDLLVDDLLKASKKAGEEIANKDVLLQIGLTGAGKTTTAHYLAGTKFEEEDVDGFAHYKPVELANENLTKFAVSGGAKSVTTTIQAVCVPFKRDDGRDDSITICDTPGFGDSKGVEQDISNGLGIIHALKGAASIKPVICIDQRTMDASQWLPLRKNLSTVIAMIGRESIDFSPFAYIFTRCEGKDKKRISKKLEGFRKVIQEDPNIEDSDILYALLTDMISKAKPGEAICIDPEETDDAPDTLKRLLSGSRLNNPAESFVNFCSKESMATLSVQVNILIHNLDISLKVANMDSAEAYLCKMIGLAKALSLPEVDQDVQKGIRLAKKFVTQLSSNIESLTARIFSDFGEMSGALSSKLHLLSKSASICNIVGMDFNCCSFINGITEGLISKIRQAISDVDPTVPQSAESLQQSITRFDSTVTLLQGLMDSDTIEKETSTMIEAIKNLIEPIFVALEVSLVSSDPTSTTLNETIDKVNFIVAMNNFFGLSKLSTLNLEFSEWVSGLDNILHNIDEKSQNCVTNLEDLDKSLDEELLGVKEWSYESLLKLNNSMEHKECRDFLQAVSSSESLSSAIDEDSTPDFKSMIRDFDDYVTKYSQQSTYFLQCKSQTVFDNVAGDMAGRVKEAKVIIESTDSVIEAMTTFEDIEPTIFKKAIQDLNDVKSRSEHFIEDSKKAPVRHSHDIRRGKTLAPTGEELAQTNRKKALLGWYKKCNELKVYWKKNGHCNVPQKDPKLGLWVFTQRQNKKRYEAGLKTAMNDEKLQHLSDMDFHWSVRKERESAVWDQRYEELKKFQEEHGHCRVSQRSGRLGIWVMEQRSKRIRSRNNKGRLEKLEEIGFFNS
ncbi:hypothetical protein FRACYDRAFT_254152 [Fragilariopsis cylindrus CCMP1102]|uniref:Helicase-associated domain-containing protein n=1 Tax=Fragilariopsis cylindrus CCMP1102 TaxID=635003 RepID=A0A1E7EL44_9STRA|nr:hypothetical protein FRACYDRAFT_254152 [Fragilariopsis cylindrus CCMP1102]|eukprot:OEU06604.1 hypothetical protein FRACYDRAFT_254152 [Fragilariopsis cylindrus CCMP1102]